MESIIDNPKKEIELLFISDLVLLIESLFDKKNRNELIFPKTDKISIIELFNLIYKISKNSFSDIDNKYTNSFLKNISTTYNSFKNASK
jgi:hypothetical protein